MARNVTLSQLRTDVAAQCDFSTSATGRYTPTLLNRIINQSIQRFRERISNEGMTHFLVSYSGVLTQGTTSTYAFQTLDLSAVSPSVVRTYGVDITIGGVVKTLAHRPFTERNDFSAGLGSDMLGTPIAWAHFQTRSIAIMPGPDGDYPYTVWYLPVLADLVADGDTFDGVAGWEIWVLWDCVCQLIARDQYEAAYAQAMAQRDSAWQDVIRSSTKVSAAGGAVVGRDSFGQAGLWGGGRQRIIPAAAGGNGGGTPNLNSVTNAMLVNRNGPIVVARLETTSGSVSDVPVASLTSYLGVFAGGPPGLVPTGTGNAADSLRGDGSWATAAASSASGLPLTQLQTISSPRVLGRITPGSGVVEELLGVSVGTMIGRYAGSGMRLVPHPTGGVQGKFLRDDGQWHVASPASLVPSGIQLPQLGDIQSPRVLGRFTAGSGVVEQLVGAQVASMVPLFNTTRDGLVPRPTGPSNNFLRDDGTWAAAGGGGSISNLPGGPTGSVQYNAGSGVFGGASGFLWNGTVLQRFGNFDMPTGVLRLGPNPTSDGEINLSHDLGGLVFKHAASGTAIPMVRLTGPAPNNIGVIGGGVEGLGRIQYETTSGEHDFRIALAKKAQINDSQLRLEAGIRLGLVQHVFPTGFGDKLGAWTASGFANVATGIHVVASGMALAFGHSPAATGVLRFTLGDKVFFSSPSGADKRVFEFGNTSPDMSYGDGEGAPASNFYDVTAGRSHHFRTGFVNRGELSASGLVMQGNSPRVQAGASGGIVHGSGFTVGANNFGGKGVFMANTARPSMAASGGGFTFVEAGALMYWGQSGTITELGPA